MKHIFAHIRLNILRGLLAVIPLALSIFAALFFYHMIDDRVMVFLDQFADVRHIPGFGAILLLVFLYLLGLAATNFIGRQVFLGIEQLSRRVPLVKQIYSLSKQMGDALSAPNQNAFKKAVLINYPNPQQWTVGFLTGRIKDLSNGEDLLKVFVPMAHPAIGFVYLAKQTQVIETGWTVPDTLKMLLSVGIVSPRQGRF